MGGQGGAQAEAARSTIGPSGIVLDRTPVQCPRLVLGLSWALLRDPSPGSKPSCCHLAESSSCTPALTSPTTAACCFLGEADAPGASMTFSSATFPTTQHPSAGPESQRDPPVSPAFLVGPACPQLSLFLLHTFACPEGLAPAYRGPLLEDSPRL